MKRVSMFVGEVPLVQALMFVAAVAAAERGLPVVTLQRRDGSFYDATGAVLTQAGEHLVYIPRDTRGRDGKPFSQVYVGGEQALMNGVVQQTATIGLRVTYSEDDVKREAWAQLRIVAQDASKSGSAHIPSRAIVTLLALTPDGEPVEAIDWDAVGEAAVAAVQQGALQGEQPKAKPSGRRSRK